MFTVNVLDSLPLSLVNDALEVFGYLKGTDCFIAGGFAKAFIIEDYKPSDIDVFCLNQKDYEIVFSRLDAKLYAVADTVNAVTFQRPGLHIQLIKPKVEATSMDQVLERFDFVQNMVALAQDKDNDKFCAYVTGDYRYSDPKQLVINHIPDVTIIVQRLFKFINLGYDCTFEEFSKIFRAWDALDNVEKNKIIGNTKSIKTPSASFEGIMESQVEIFGEVKIEDEFEF
jgi:hypothetical protein